MAVELLSTMGTKASSVQGPDHLHVIRISSKGMAVHTSRKETLHSQFSATADSDAYKKLEADPPVVEGRPVVAYAAKIRLELTALSPPPFINIHHPPPQSSVVPRRQSVSNEAEL